MKIAATVLAVALCISLIYLFEGLQVLSGLISIVFLALMLVFINNAPNMMLTKPQAIVENECDPYPFLDAVDEALTFRLAPAVKQAMLINRAAALSWCGNKKEYCEMIKAINIDAVSGVPTVNKYVYYHNLCDVYTIEGNYAAADAIYDKAEQLYSLLKPKLKDALLFTNRFAECEHLYRQGEVALAREMAELLINSAPTKMSQVAIMLFAARLCIELGDNTAAREKLEAVIERGNRLYAVTEAKALLEPLYAE